MPTHYLSLKVFTHKKTPKKEIVPNSNISNDGREKSLNLLNNLYMRINLQYDLTNMCNFRLKQTELEWIDSP